MSLVASDVNSPFRILLSPSFSGSWGRQAVTGNTWAMICSWFVWHWVMAHFGWLKLEMEWNWCDFCISWESKINSEKSKFQTEVKGTLQATFTALTNQRKSWFLYLFISLSQGYRKLIHWNLFFFSQHSFQAKTRQVHSAVVCFSFCLVHLCYHLFWKCVLVNLIAFFDFHISPSSACLDIAMCS